MKSIILSALSTVIVLYTSVAFADRQLTLMDVMPSARDMIYVDQQAQQARQNQIMYQQQLEDARLEYQRKQFEFQQQQEIATKKQRILDLQLEEAEAKAVERKQKSITTQDPVEAK